MSHIAVSACIIHLMIEQSKQDNNHIYTFHYIYIYTVMPTEMYVRAWNYTLEGTIGKEHARTRVLKLKILLSSDSEST